ncbi:hypothetical protein DL93DRAFT_2234707 [Clavulina sp. PMI_390]|nr:hypothetical protein DL93DRAFT_2234707 [Clavulina sp. PMI_390]
MKPLATSLSSTFKIRDLGSGFADTVDNTPSHSFLDNDRDQWIVDQIQARKSFVINNVQSSASWSRLAPLVTPKALFNHHHGVDDYTSLNKYNPATNDSTPIGARHALKLVSNSTGSYEAATPPVTFRDIGLREEVKAILKKIVPSMLYPRDEQFDAHSKSNHPPEVRHLF